jgi:Leucine-rich repeat (LRR) protein
VDYIEDDGWDFCRELWQLELRGNELKIVERDILRKLPALTHLDLRDNLISHIDADGAFVEVRYRKATKKLKFSQLEIKEHGIIRIFFLNKHSTGILFLLLNENGNVRLFS